MIRMFRCFQRTRTLLARPALFPIFLACALSDHYVREQQYHKSNNMVSNLLIAIANISLVIRLRCSHLNTERTANTVFRLSGCPGRFHIVCLVIVHLYQRNLRNE